jgi:hypothetical protein
LEVKLILQRKLLSEYLIWWQDFWIILSLDRLFARYRFRDRSNLPLPIEIHCKDYWCGWTSLTTFVAKYLFNLKMDLILVLSGYLGLNKSSLRQSGRRKKHNNYNPRLTNYYFQSLTYNWLSYFLEEFLLVCVFWSDVVKGEIFLLVISLDNNSIILWLAQNDRPSLILLIRSDGPYPYVDLDSLLEVVIHNFRLYISILHSYIFATLFLSFAVINYSFHLNVHQNILKSNAYF